jgi:hypothetical protein
VAIGLLVEIIGDASKLSSELDTAQGKTTAFGDSAVGSALKVAAIGAAAVGVAVAIGDMTMAAAEDRAEQEKLITTYGNLGIGLEEATAATEAAIAAGAEKAFSDSEIRAGLQSLITATGDAAAANAALGPTLDIARAAGVSAEVAADAYSKALAGNDAALRKLFPGMTKQASAADTITEATKLSKGAADDYATSAEGMGKRGSDAFGELSETIGGAFLPIMDEIVPALIPILEMLGELIKELLPLLKPVIMLIVEALKIFIGVLKTLIGVIQDVLGFVGDMVAKIQDAANFIGSVDLNPFAAGGGGEAAAGYGRSGRSGRSGGGGSGGANVTVNVQSADPTEVVRAIRRWARANGGSAPFTRGLDRSTA